MIIYNANTTSQEVKLPHQGEWKVVVDDKQAGTNVLRTLPQATKVNVAPLSMMVLYDEEDRYVSVPTTLEVSTQ
ncbi:MAG: hypothetical protein RR448_00815 [Niameybacter sp.]|uniref:hypothetical protein n=1 Tax=Niameybacter sp. TaxID=2033640 RepID=UPI002FCBE4C3